jgi:hypothetical protein
MGRADAASAGAGTLLSLDIDGLAAWQITDVLTLFSTGAGVIVVPGVADTDNLPAPADTDLDAMAIDFRRIPGPRRLIDGSRGDTAHLFQLTTRPAALGDYLALARHAELPSFTMTSGATTSVAGTLAEVPQQTVELRVSRGGFAELVTGFHAAATRVSEQVAIGALPRWREFGPYGFGFPDLLVYAPPADPAADLDETLEYGDPFPASWDRFLVVASYVSVNVLAPGAFDPVDVVGVFSRVVPLDDVGDAPIAPALGPARSPTIGGRDASAEQEGVTTAPELAWDAPALGSPDRYDVTLMRVFVDPALPTTTLIEPVGVFHTGDRRFVVPPGVLTQGNRYLALIQAHARHGAGFSSSSLVTAPFVP